MKTCTYDRPPDALDEPRRELAAASRKLRELKALLEKNGGRELFASDAPTSMEAAIYEAEIWRDHCAASLNFLKTRAVQRAPVRGAHRDIVPNDCSSLVPLPGPTTYASAAPQPASLTPLAPVFAAWCQADAIANDPLRPVAVEGLRVPALASLQAARGRERLMREVQASMPAGHRALLSDAIQEAEEQRDHEIKLLDELDDPNHHAVAAVREWELLHPGADRNAADARMALGAAVSVRAAMPGHEFVPLLPAHVNDADRARWNSAVTLQLVYREKHGVSGRSPLGPEPWPEVQKEEWDEAREQLTAVGVDFGRPSLKAALERGQLEHGELGLARSLEYSTAVV